MNRDTTIRIKGWPDYICATIRKPDIKMQTGYVDITSLETQGSWNEISPEIDFKSFEVGGDCTFTGSGIKRAFCTGNRLELELAVPHIGNVSADFVVAVSRAVDGGYKLLVVSNGPVDLHGATGGKEPN